MTHTETLNQMKDLSGQTLKHLTKYKPRSKATSNHEKFAAHITTNSAANIVEKIFGLPPN